MKRFLLFFLMCSLNHFIFGQISEQQALHKATEFFQKEGPHKVPGQPALPIQLSYIQKTFITHQPAVYVFNRGQGNGFVLIRADSEGSIIGYSDMGSFEMENAPDNIRFWLESYAEGVYSQGLRGDLMGANASPMEKTYTPVAPLIKAHWSQNAPYNAKCPIDRGTNSAVGCVAVAFGQLMHYYQYPKQGKGSTSYNWQNTLLFANFDSTTYAWDRMPNQLTDESSQQEIDAVATFLYHVGVACHMSYCKLSSGAYMNDIMEAMHKNFDYDLSYCFLPAVYYQTSTILAYINEELVHSRPIVVSARSASGGHSFLCDGIDEYGFVHINWGWGGNNDGYYSITKMNPGNSSFEYNMDVEFFLNLVPEHGGASIPTIGVECPIVSNVKISRTNPTTSFVFQGLNNPSYSSSFGQLGFRVLTMDGEYKTTIADSQGWNLEKHNRMRNPIANISVSWSNLPIGDYIISPCFVTTNYPQGVPVLVYGYGEEKAQLSITNDSLIFIADTIPMEEPENRHIPLDEEESNCIEIFKDYSFVPDAEQPGCFHLTSSSLELRQVDIVFHVDPSLTTVPKGVYPISFTKKVNTIEAGRGLGNVQEGKGSFVSEINYMGTIKKIWFPTRGLLEVQDHAVVFNGYNSQMKRVYLEFGLISHNERPTIQDLEESGFFLDNKTTHIFVVKLNQEICYDLVWYGETVNFLFNYPRFKRIIGYDNWWAVSIFHPQSFIEHGCLLQLTREEKTMAMLQSGDTASWKFESYPGFNTPRFLSQHKAPYAQLELEGEGYYLAELLHFSNHHTPCGKSYEDYNINLYLPEFCDEIAAYNTGDSIFLIGDTNGAEEGVCARPVWNAWKELASYLFTFTGARGTEISLRFGTKPTSFSLMCNGQPIPSKVLTENHLDYWMYDDVEEGYYFDVCRKTPSILEPTPQESSPVRNTRKYILNNSLIIDLNGVKYNIFGHRINHPTHDF